MRARHPALHRGLPPGAALVAALAAGDASVLKTEPRRRLYNALVSFPGLHLAALAREAEVDERLARYHMRVLVKTGLATKRKQGNRNLYYPRVEAEPGARETVDRRDKQALAVLRRPVPLRMVLLLLEKESHATTMGELAEGADVSPGTATYHVSNLEEAGLVEVQAEGRSRVARLREPEHVRELLAEFPPPQDIVSGFIEFWDQLEI